ncbi:MAG: L-rhamnose isomerase, partial [Candidatus Firestonebacteria bacterium]
TESLKGALSGGLLATGNHPGRARNGDELRADADFALSLAGGKHRFNIHAKYAETNGKTVERNELKLEHFGRWIDWAKSKKLALDFNPTFFSHPKAASGFTLSSADEGIRNFWIEHALASRKIASGMGKVQKTAAVNNIWIPDGYKDEPADRKAPRERLKKSLDKIFALKLPASSILDAVEGKLFGLGSESYVTGSYDFYLSYAAKKGLMITLDTGHFHPTEAVADKLSAILSNLDRLLLHVSRGVRWDSDHVVVLNDELKSLASEIVRGDYLDRVYLALDYFDASINRVAAWVTGLRATRKALLFALLEPAAKLRAYEQDGNFTGRLALSEEIKTLPLGLVWEEFCQRNEVPAERDWLKEVERYEKQVLSLRQ